MIEPLEVVEKRAILDALSELDGHVSRAAAALGIGQATLYRKLKLFGVDLSGIRKGPVVWECECGKDMGNERVIARCRPCADRTGLPAYSVK